MDNNYVDSAGNVRISEEVVATIASVSAAEIEGVCSLVPCGSEIKKLLSAKRGPGKCVRIELSGGEITVEMGVVLRYGVRMQEVVAKLQAEVKHAIESMTSMKVHSVNVCVQGVETGEDMPKTEEAPQE